ncbi:MAG: hypothetical protein PQJ58_00290 [Spirochaetales bacterium]|nr:hypothetical protein [Spirochaetales bacterium]
MTGEELKSWTETCLDELEIKLKNLKDKFGLGSLDGYHLDTDKGLLIFEKDGKPACSFKALAIGTLVPDQQNWLWGWANRSLPEEMRNASGELKGLREETGFNIFEIESFKADTALAQELSALAVHVLGADGLYRVIGDQTVLYLALSEGKILSP